jgi:hypothetical protein
MDNGLRKTEEKEKDHSRGMQGIDKAPGEETPQSTEQFIAETQKGKKVDGDPSREEDAPPDRQDID